MQGQLHVCVTIYTSQTPRGNQKFTLYLHPFTTFDMLFISFFPSIGEGRLREVFLKTDNNFGGKYFAQLINVSVHIIMLVVGSYMAIFVA